MQSGNTVVDIGAHVGVFSIYIASRSPSIKVFSYEPHPQNFQLLAQNINLNSLRNIKPIQLAIGKTSEKRKLFIGSGGVTHSLVKSKDSYVEVDCITLKEVLSQLTECNFLKIDCEGAEYEILFNTPVECLDNVEKISIECHNVADFVPEKDNYNAYGLKAYLENLGFSVTLVETISRRFIYLYARR